MKINITPNSVSTEELKAKVASQFPNYEIINKNKNFFVVKKSKTEGCNVVVRKKSIAVVGNFPTMGGQMLFALSIFALGVLIPLVIYLAAFQGKLKKLENEVGAYIKSEVNA